MVTSNFRLLLVAVIVLSNCISWTVSRHHYTHNVNGHRSRHRRNGAGLFLSSSYIIPGGEGSGAWGEWGKVSPCSRTCGGGVASQKRICLTDGQPPCIGGDTKYFSCQTQDCPEGSVDFRAEQCAEYNNVQYGKNIYYNWVPYTKSSNPCELSCMPQTERFSYTHKPKVVDGTRCNDETFDVCVDGVCRPVGCDMMLGSNAREDKCRHCRGNGTHCRTFEGVINAQNFTKGYNDVLLIPEGSTSIIIYENPASNNYLAIRSRDVDKYYLNGGYRIDFPSSSIIAGSVWHYERSSHGPEKIRSLGPTTEPLYLSLILLDDSVGINYEYSIPSSLAPPPYQKYNWVHSEFTPCSATCGGGVQTREVTCRTNDELDEVDATLCDDSFKPVNNQTCNTDPCPPRWVTGPWSPCSKHCGEGGTSSRQVRCEKVFGNGYPSTVGDKECFDILGPKPELYQECNRNATCPSWFAGPWKPCDRLCDEGKQTRQVICHQRTNGHVELFEDKDCPEKKPPVEKSCLLQKCNGVDWVLGDWTGCDSCLSKFRTRIAHCVTRDRQVVNSSLCHYHAQPILEEPCDKGKLPACEVQWYATQWSDCSAECGKGQQSRRVFCGLFDGASVVKVDDDRCSKLNKYNDTQECEVPADKCPAKWFAGPWSKCTKPCGGGGQSRKVICLNGHQESRDCNENATLDAYQSCNEGPCDKDEMLPLDSKSTPVMNEDYDYGECIEDNDDYPEAGAEDIEGELIHVTLSDVLFSDAPDIDGSGDFSTYTEIESEFTAVDESYEPTITETIITETTDSTGETETTESTLETETTESTETEPTESTLETETTESTLETETTESTETEPTESTLETETTESTLETETTESTGETVTTDASTDVSTGSTDRETSSEANNKESKTTENGTEQTTETGTTESGTTESGTTESGTTESGTTESGSTESESTESETRESGTTEPGTTESGTTESGTTESETTESGTTESGTTESETTESGPTESGTTESGTTESGTTESGTTESGTTESGTTESGTTESGTTESGTTESGTTESGTTESGSTESGTTESGTTESDTTESGTTESGTTESETSESGTTESGTTESGTTESETTESGTTESGTTENGTTESGTTESGTTESGTTESGSTESESTETSETTESLSSTGSTYDVSTESTSEGGSSSTEVTSEAISTTEYTSEPRATTPWDLPSTVAVYKNKLKCKKRKKISKCHRSEFGCCADLKTAAKGPFDEGCPNSSKTCNETSFGCCPDGVSAASNSRGKGCPVAPCVETLYGCCKSDNVTAAEGNDDEGCPPPPPLCTATKYGCCDDGTMAKGPNKKGCPEIESIILTVTTPRDTTESSTTEPEERYTCSTSTYGCCFDNETDASGPNGEGCPCSISEFGCCPDAEVPAQGPNLEGCIMSCNVSTYGCCPDGDTPAHGPDHQGCCLQSAFGCCPDNYKPADGPHLEGCGCQYARFGCCPDNITIARGPDNDGCGCRYSQYGCCPDGHTPATGLDLIGCACHTYQFGCCPDGVTVAIGENFQGCLCQQSTFGCCGDGVTHAKGPNEDGCDCSNSKFGCCPDGVTVAVGRKFLNCTDVPENRQEACGLPKHNGECRNHSVYWFYDTSYGGCTRFWYGGCGGNGNKFQTKEECEDVCEHPAPKDACKLPKVKGVCNNYYVKWYYDSAREQCSQFVYGGCLGNDNKFDTMEACQERCEPQKTEDQCNLPIERGSCEGNFLRWGYDPETRQCTRFIWGGCEGNENKFSSEAACLQRCNPPGATQPQCKLPQEVGNCTEKHPMWSFSQAENRCVPFYYTGCGGNENMFETENACTDACPNAYVQEMCTLPSKVGECSDYTMRWFFDTTKRRCRQFYYGGCGGNENNFISESECENRCTEQVITTTLQPLPYQSESCFLELDVGPCTQYEDRWGYDSARGSCVQFQYGGCGGNNNNFPDVKHCQYYCSRAQDVCQLPMMSGPCDGSFMKWFYDATSDTCSQFTYGGCQGNENRFSTREDCERRCRTAPAPVTELTSTTTAAISNRPSKIYEECRISSSLETCLGTKELVWYLEPTQHICVSHDNAESGHTCLNTGVFTSEEECERYCGAFQGVDVCHSAVDPGPCTESITKVFYNVAADRCEWFTYGGCHGGSNRFSTMEECEDHCRPEADPCKQSPEPGNCLDDQDMWYYHRASDTCQIFSYGGCHGNDNRFTTQDECEARCQKSSSSTTRKTTISSITDSTTISPSVNTHIVVDEECKAPPSLEPCGRNITAYYYDSRTQACLAGDIGGCRYANSYRTEEECERQCGAFRGLDVCNAQRDPGSCIYSIPKFYWDVSLGRCEPYIYGGCQGGPNRFSTEDECEEVCGTSRIEDQCLQPVSTGEACSWDTGSRRWHYSASYEDCLPFVFMGCGGNENNFRSYQECKERCKMLQSLESNEIVPVEMDCLKYQEECSTIRCEYSVQRTRTAGGCERCSCVQVEVNCAPLTQECANIKCAYGIHKTLGDDGCTRCSCYEHPCANKHCASGERCVSSAYRIPLQEDTQYSTECRVVNKPGECPAESLEVETISQCRRECNDDADCLGVAKCCSSGCHHLCVEPASATSPAPRPTYAPELPQVPQPNVETEPEVNATEGGKATLKCLFHGNPPPKITWRRNEITIDGDIGRYRLLSDGALEIVSLYRNDSGVYICIADNGLGSATQEIRLQVNDPVEGPTGIASIPDAVIVGNLGQSLNIRCLAYGYPPPTIYWYHGKNGPMVPYSSSLYEARGNILQIRNLNEDTIGDYICQAYNGIGKPAEWSFVVQAYQPDDSEADPNAIFRSNEVLVTPPLRTTQTEATTTPEPEIKVPLYSVPVSTQINVEHTRVVAGSDISLACDVDGYPEPRVSWTRDRMLLIATDRIQITETRLTVFRANLNDSGLYGCEAANLFSSHSSEVQINVEGLYIPPTCLDNPYFANCGLIVRSNYCRHKYYSKFCCKSCVTAGQLDPQEFEMQADMSFRKK